MLLKFVGQKKESWQDYLDSCVYAYNTAKHESTKFSPFEVMFFRKGVLPVDFTNARNCSGELHLSNSETADVPSECIENRRVQLETVKKNIIKAQAVQKKQYDRKNHKPEVFVVGSIVLKKDFLRKKRAHGKLDPRWIGPYKIIKSLGRGLYGLQLVDDPSRIVSRVNGVHLKPYHYPVHSDLTLSSHDLNHSPSSHNDHNHSPSSYSDPNRSSSSQNHSPSSHNLNHSPSSYRQLNQCYTGSQLDLSLTPSLLHPSPSVIVHGVTSSTPILQGGFFAEFNVDVLATPPPATETPPPPATETPLPPATATPPPPATATPPPPATETPLPPAIVMTPSPLIASQPTSAADNYCNCRQRCATKRCPCKKRRSPCGSMCHPGRRCANIVYKETELPVIDLTTCNAQLVDGKDDFWTTVGDLRLTHKDKRDLGSRSHAWLNDRHMTAAQTLLKKEHPHIAGLQATTLQYTRTFDVHQEKEFVQILNLSASHWITISTVDCPLGTIRVYDSLQLGLNSSLKRLIADLMFHQGKKIKIEYVNMQQQRGPNDCGLFAIATATALCNGIDPNKLEFTQKGMRQHFANAIEMKMLSPFPASRVSARQPIVYLAEYLRVYCVCRQLSRSPMIECSSCSEWFHTDCVRAPVDVMKDKELPWFCDSCN